MGVLRKVRDLIVYRDERYYCGPGPSAVQTADGRILLAFRRARNWVPEGVYVHGAADTEACLVESGDGGRTWSEPRVFNRGFITNQNLTLLPDGTILCLTQFGELIPLAVYERLNERGGVGRDQRFGWAFAEGGAQVLRSADRGQTWEGPFWISPIPDLPPLLRDSASPAFLRGSAIVLDDGSAGVSVYGLHDSTTYRSTVWFAASADRGASWEVRGVIARDDGQPVYYNETGLYQCPSGKIVAFVRTDRDPERRPYLAASIDGGRSWTPPRPLAMRGYPLQAARLPSGNVLLAYGYRYEPFGVRARLLDPECTDVEAAPELVLRDDGGVGDLGYPHVLVLADGTALVSYYHNTADGVPSGLRYVAATIVAED